METLFRQLPTDILIKTALDLTLSDLYNLCQSDKKINEKLCKNYNFWIKKLQNDFYVNFYEIDNNILKNPKDIYLKLNSDFDDVMEENLVDYPDKLKNLLFKSGYINEFKTEISKTLGPLYSKSFDFDFIFDFVYVNTNHILEKYFYNGGDSSGFYPLEETCYTMRGIFDINQKD